MNRIAEFLSESWLLLLLALLAAGLLFRALRALRSPSALLSTSGVIGCFALLLLIGYFFPGRYHPAGMGIERGNFPLWVVAGGGGLLFLLLTLLLITGRWSLKLGTLTIAAILLGLGGSLIAPAQVGGVEVVRSIRSIELVQPGWLVLLLVLPVIVRMSYHSLAGLGPFRRWAALSLRCLLVTVVVLALAEPRLRRPNENVTVLYVIDRSLSVPQDIDPNTGDSTPQDRRWRRLRDFVNEAVSRRGNDHRNDQSGVIYFGKRPRLVMPPGAVDRMYLADALTASVDPNYTDISAALKLAMASFPEGSGKRIVLISDGNENLGSAEEQAALARQNGIQIDSIPVAVGYRNENEVLVERVEAPRNTARGARLPVSVQVRNANPSRIVYGTLELIQTRDGEEKPVQIVEGNDVVDAKRFPAIVRLRPGLNSFAFRDKADSVKGEEEFSFTYRAVFTPIESRDERNQDPKAGLPGDRVQNNRAMAHVIARGQRRILLIEEPDPKTGNGHEYLIRQLRNAKFNITPVSIGKLPQNKGELSVFLSNYDCVIVADVPADLLTPDRQEIIRSNTYDQGCGLIVIGGPDSYGAGGYQKTPLEKALPVDCDIKAMKAAGKGGLVLIMHASEMAEGNFWQKKIAKLAIERLSPIDMVGVLYFDFNGVKWHVPFQTVGYDKGRFFNLIDRMTPGDMPDFDPFFVAAHKTLANPDYGLTTKHCIVISDGDPQYAGQGKTAIANMKTDGITCSTVGVATHGVNEDKKMTEIAEGAYPGGKFYNVKDPTQLPAIYIRESRRVSQSYIHDKQFNPKLLLRSGPTEKLEAPLPDLFGFVRTTMKNSPLAEMLIEGPTTFDQRFPILAAWQYGLGRSVAYTSDARTIPGKIEGWDRTWAGSEMYLKFWENTVNWTLRGLETDKLQVTTEYRDGKIKVVVEARDENGKPITDLKIDGGITLPGVGDNAKPVTLNLEQKTGGIYEGEFKAEDAGSYLVNVRARQMVPMFADGLPRYRGRTGPVATKITEKNGKFLLEDGTEVLKKANGTLVYADDGKPVEVLDKQEKVIDSRRSGVSLSYSPEFADLESNSALLKSLTRTTGGNVYSEEDEALMKVARTGELYRPSIAGFRSLLPIWYWLVFVSAILLLLDVGIRRIALEPGELRAAGVHLWGRLRKVPATAAEQESETLTRLKQRKASVTETLAKSRASRRFEPSADAPPPPAGADEMIEKTAGSFTPPPPSTETKKATEPEPEDYFAKLRKAKSRAPVDRPKPEDEG